MAKHLIGCDHLIRVDWLKQAVIVFHDHAEAKTELAAFGAEVGECGAASASWAINERDGSGLFWMIFPGGSPTTGQIVHEAIHVVDFLCEFAGIPVTVECGEVRAYMVEWLTERLMGIYFDSKEADE